MLFRNFKALLLIRKSFGCFLDLARPHSFSAMQKNSPSAMGNTVSKRPLALTLLLILLIGVFYLATLRQGHDWGDDFGMYIHHARNMVEGKSYEDTGYVFNARRIIGPKTYPPIFPLILAPIYWGWGINLTAMKVEAILIFLLSLFAIYLSFKNDLHWPFLTGLIAVIGLNPQFWQFKDRIASDFLFLLFLYLSFYFVHEAERPNRPRRSQILYAVLISLSIFLACGTRSIGLILIPCLFIYYIFKSKKLGLAGIFTLLLTPVVIYLQESYSQIFSAYTGHFGINQTDVVLAYSKELIQYFSEFWINGYSKAFRLFLSATLIGLAIIGYVARVRKKGLTCFELFLLLYLPPFVLLPISLALRFLIPIIPLMIFYSFFGIQVISQLARQRQQRVEKMMGIAVVIAILGSYAGQYTQVEYGPFQNGITKNEAQQLFEYVRQEIGENEVVIFRKPRVLSLFTGRAAAVWHNSTEDEELWNFFRQINASYLIVGPENVEPYDQAFIRAFVDRNPARFQQTFANADFQVYRIVQDTT